MKKQPKEFTEEQEELISTVRAYFTNNSHKWTTSSEFEKITGIKPAKLRSVSFILREHHYPLASTTQDGYKLATKIEDFDRTLAHLYGRLRKQSRAARAMVECKEKFIAKLEDRPPPPEQLEFGFNDAQIIVDKVDLAIKSFKKDGENT